jgi:hypothetical protein
MAGFKKKGTLTRKAGWNCGDVRISFIIELDYDVDNIEELNKIVDSTFSRLQTDPFMDAVKKAKEILDA